MPSWTPDVRPCPPGLHEDALQVLYRRVPASLRGHLIRDVLKESRRGQVDLAGLWVALEPAGKGDRPPERRRILGAMLTQSLAGRAAAVWPPEVTPSLRRKAIAAALARAALADLQARGVRIAQAVLDESAGRQGAADLVRGGLPGVTELLYLERDTKVPLIFPGAERPRPAVAWEPFDPSREGELRSLLEATYRDSLDMPELEGVRSLDDIIEGHRATGRFVPERWQLGHVPGRPGLGIALLLSEFPERDAWEIAYLGLTPSARGCGLGREAIRRGLELAAPHTPRLVLAVDVRNHPATRLYRAAGFTPFDRRRVHLVVFPERGEAP